MAAESPNVVSIAVEGFTDEVVATSLVQHVGALPGRIFGRQGKPSLRDRVRGFASAARHHPWFVLVDLDRDVECAAALRASWVPSIPEHLCFRVAVRALEAWLLADARGVARFLRVPESRVPTHPEELPDPKSALVALAGHAPRRELRAGMSPRPGSGRSVGPLYPSHVASFVQQYWSIEQAARRSESLARAIRCLERFTPGRRT